MEAFGLARLRVRGFRSAIDVTLEPGRLCALVGEANVGKSNLLVAIRALLDPATVMLDSDDVSVGGSGEIAIDATLVGGGELSLVWRPPGGSRRSAGQAPPLAFLPGDLRTGEVLASPVADLARTLAEQLRRDGHGSATAPAASLVDAIATCCAHGIHGLVVLIEEPEMYLRPQAQRYLYRLLRRLADAGNQVIYSTHCSWRARSCSWRVRPRSWPFPLCSTRSATTSTAKESRSWHVVASPTSRCSPVCAGRCVCRSSRCTIAMLRVAGVRRAQRSASTR